MAFKIVKISGNGTYQNVIVNDSITESVIHSFIVYNTTNTDATVSMQVGGTTILVEVVPANSRISITDKINIENNTIATLNTPNGINATISYYAQAIDVTAANTTVQQMVADVEADKTSVALNKAFVESKLTNTNIANIDNVVSHMASIVDASTQAEIASTQAVIAQSAANYKGDWDSNYTDGYALADNVTYTDGYNYVSKIDENTVEPTSETNTTEWNFIEAVSPTDLADTASSTKNYSIAMAVALG